MTPAYTWIFTASAVFHALVFIVTLVVVWIGWLRQRRIGFLVLVVWVLVGLFNIMGPALWMAVASGWLTKLFPTVPQHLVTVLPNVLGSFVSSVLLMTGLALLVFRGPTAMKTNAN